VCVWLCNCCAGFCFEAQGFPNAVNTPTFPSVILRPNEVRAWGLYIFIFIIDYNCNIAQTGFVGG